MWLVNPTSSNKTKCRPVDRLRKTRSVTSNQARTGKTGPLLKDHGAEMYLQPMEGRVETSSRVKKSNAADL